MIIACDIDDVILDLVPTWLDAYNRDYNDSLTKDKLTDWNIASFVKPECGTKIYDYIAFSDIFYGSNPVVGALDGVNKFRSWDYRIIFVTANDPEGCKFPWLKEHGFIKDRKDFIVAYDKSLILADILIDDKYDNVISFPREAILFTQPWNEKYDYDYRSYGWNGGWSDIK